MVIIQDKNQRVFLDIEFTKIHLHTNNIFRIVGRYTRIMMITSECSLPTSVLQEKPFVSLCLSPPLSEWGPSSPSPWPPSSSWPEQTRSSWGSSAWQFPIYISVSDISEQSDGNQWKQSWILINSRKIMYFVWFGKGSK